LQCEDEIEARAAEACPPDGEVRSRVRAYQAPQLGSKHPKRKRHLRKATLVSHAERRLKRLLQA